MKDFDRVFDVLQYQNGKYPNARAVNSFYNGEWNSKSINDVIENADAISHWLIQQGYRKGDKVAVIPSLGNSEWLILDFAFQQVGMILVPIHPTATVSDTEFILNETESVLCITFDYNHFQKVRSIENKSISNDCIFHLERNVEGFFKPLLQPLTIDYSLLNERKNSIDKEDILAILYTSGTTSFPKGVMLTHSNVVSSIKSVLLILPLTPKHRVLSFLPFSHIFERTTCFTYLAFGVQIYFSTSHATLNNDFRLVKPHFCTCVPKTMEKMVDILNKKLYEKNWIRKKIIKWAMQIGVKYKGIRGQSLVYHFKLFLARLLVLNTFKKPLGGKLKYMAVGAAALQPDIARLFSASGIVALSGYGMTETSPFISTNRPEPGLNRFGTVGIPVAGVEVKIDSLDENNEGEILIKGPNVMKGYFKHPELTKEVFTTDGWFKTGDVGKIESKRFLVITDRKKNIFKTSSGKFVSPQVLENHFTSSPFISQCLIMGFNRPFVSAMFVPNFTLLKTWCDEQGIHWTAPNYMIYNVKVVKKIQEEVDNLNESLQGYERVKKFLLCEEEWTVENKDLTTSFKPKRNNLLEKHSKEIEKIYR
jgi:long-chain acyl-CoA synthetase